MFVYTTAILKSYSLKTILKLRKELQRKKSKRAAVLGTQSKKFK